MEIFITVLMLIVPIVSLVSLFLAVRATRRAKALKELVMTLANQVNRDMTPTEKAMSRFNMSEL